jgi:hypothetical protein
MPDPITKTRKAQALHRDLQDNETHCLRRNVIVHVNTITDDHRVAYCSVEQRIVGILRRQLSTHELIHCAQRALAPLTALGLIPLLTVHHERQRNASAPTTQRPKFLGMDWITDLWKWLGYPMAREEFGVVRLVHDPFGWRRAMMSSHPK